MESFLGNEFYIFIYVFEGAEHESEVCHLEKRAEKKLLKKNTKKSLLGVAFYLVT